MNLWSHKLSVVFILFDFLRNFLLEKSYRLSVEALENPDKQGKKRGRKKRRKEGKKKTFNYINFFFLSLNISLCIWVCSVLSFLVWARLSRLLQ